MKSIAALLCAFAAMAHAENVRPEEWALRYAIVHATHAEDFAHLYEEVDLAVPGSSPTTGDLLAEYLLQHANDAKFDGNESAHVVEMLGRIPGGRYRATMEKLRAMDAPVTLKFAAFRYLQQHPDDGSRYVPGAADFDRQIALYSQDALAAPVSEDRARRLGELKKGDSLARLVEVMGKPQAAKAVEVMGFRRILFYYRGAGRVVYGTKGKGEFLMQSVTADPLLFESEMPYRADPGRYAEPDDYALRMMQLMSGRPLVMKLALDASLNAPPSLELYDTAAEILVRTPGPIGSADEDTWAWFVRLLRTRGGPRYSAVVTDFDHRANNYKVRNYARRPLGSWRSVPTAAYVPGTISLDDIARRYPPLYPDIHYASGIL